jgi:hypothetical protein
MAAFAYQERMAGYALMRIAPVACAVSLLVIALSLRTLWHSLLA